MVIEAEQSPKGPGWRYMNSKRLRIVELLYLLMTVLSFYLLFISRSGEVRTVWEVLHPAFIPVFFATTALLLVAIFSSEQVKYKLVLTIVHSILSHIFFVVIFPAGYFGAQQTVLGKTRLVYDNVIFGGIPLGPENILVQIYNWVRGINFLAALSVILTRMSGIDFFWGHLFFVPLLWGTLVPVAAFLVTRAFGEDENVSVLSSLLVSLFPISIAFGTYSMPFTLSCIFFFCSIYFILRYLFTDGLKASCLMIIFSFATVVSHSLTGTLVISLVFLAIALKNYENEKAKNPISAKISLLLSFIVSTILLPCVLLIFRLISPVARVSFSLDKLSELSPTEIVVELVLGRYVDFPLVQALIWVLGPLLGFVGLIYVFRSGIKAGSSRTRRVSAMFLLLGFLVVSVDYRILRLFMVNLPFEDFRLWVFQDFMVIPFVAVLISAIVTSLQRRTSKPARIHERLQLSKVPSGLKFVTTFALILLLSGWITASVYYAYPHYGPLQTTWYELEAMKHIEEDTKEKYVVIGDIWTNFAGEMIVGKNNPRAYYFGPYNKTGYDLLVNMRQNPSPQWMLQAMNSTGTGETTIAYFIITEPRINPEDYNRIITQALQNDDLQLYGVFGEGKLHVFYYMKETNTQ